jgi:hypothetical protein
VLLDEEFEENSILTFCPSDSKLGKQTIECTSTTLASEPTPFPADLTLLDEMILLYEQDSTE